MGGFGKTRNQNLNLEKVSFVDVSRGALLCFMI